MKRATTMIPAAQVVGADGATLTVRTAAHGLLRVPADVVDDESEVWRVGDAGTLLVARWWAAQQGIRSPRQPRARVAPAKGAPVELDRKPLRLVPRPAPPPVPVPPVPPAPAVPAPSKDRSMRRSLRRIMSRVLKMGALPALHETPAHTCAQLEGEVAPWTWPELAAIEAREPQRAFNAFLRCYGIRGALALALASSPKRKGRQCPVQRRIADLTVGRQPPASLIVASPRISPACARCWMGRHGWPCLWRQRGNPEGLMAARANMAAWYSRLLAEQGALPTRSHIVALPPDWQLRYELGDSHDPTRPDHVPFSC